ncbi:hypothetical protein CBW21_16650 [Chromobacterium violaceum]|uniref:Uncharacterized protein n=2 Tax=Chromobacterium violaceum TaxID=536 RepID=Q7NUJ6_CHRVO|nr:hypothetical protein CV_2701 [Chromobacterium violaceum ATCC 12472]OVE46779.1 hypothetical protein CBW21_16650 [Chromobacterium violaceum]
MSSVLCLIGIFSIFVIQILLFFSALAESKGKAVLCLVFPLYLFYFAKKNKEAGRLLVPLYLAVGLFAIGVVIS